MRFTIFLLAAFLIFSSACMAEETAVNFGFGAAVIDEHGAGVLPAGSYGEIYVLQNDDGTTSGYAAGTEDGYLLLYPDGEKVADVLCSEIRAAGSGFIIRRGYEYRYYASRGILTVTGYCSMVYTGLSNCIALTGNAFDEISDALSVILPDGRVIDTEIRSVYALTEFSEGLMPLCDAETNLYGYIDANGAWAIAPGYDYAGNFKDGFAIVTADGKYGIINKGGQIEIPPAYELMLRTDEIIAGLTGSRAHFWDADVNEIGNMETGGASVSLTGARVVLTDETSTRVCEASGAELFTSGSGVEVSGAAGVFMLRDGPWSAESAYLADISGSRISGKYNTVKYLGEGVFAYGATDGDSAKMRFGLLNANGMEITDAIYDSITYVSQGMLCATTGISALILDMEGETLNTLM